jgi:hypothetical protein
MAVALVITSDFFKTDTLPFLFSKRILLAFTSSGVESSHFNRDYIALLNRFVASASSTDNNLPFRMKLDINRVLVVEDEVMNTMRLRIILIICCTNASYSSFRRR